MEQLLVQRTTASWSCLFRHVYVEEGITITVLIILVIDQKYSLCYENSSIDNLWLFKW